MIPHQIVYNLIYCDLESKVCQSQGAYGLLTVSEGEIRECCKAVNQLINCNSFLIFRKFVLRCKYSFLFSSTLWYCYCFFGSYQSVIVKWNKKRWVLVLEQKDYKRGMWVCHDSNPSLLYKEIELNLSYEKNDEMGSFPAAFMMDDRQ